MWPQDPNKYSLIKRVVRSPESPWRPLTYWQTDVKNLHFAYQLLKYAKDPGYTEGRNWYDRSRRKFTEYGLLNNAGRPSRAGMRFLKQVEDCLEDNHDFFKKNVNPFELEYLFHKQLYGTGAHKIFDNLQNLLTLVPEIHVDDLESIVSVVSINNRDATLERFHSLNNEEKKQLFKEITDLQKELKESGGKIAVKDAARPEWLPYLDLISIGALGNQNDGYYRAASLLRAHILLITFLKVRDGGTHTFEDLYNPFRSNIEEDSFSQLLRTDLEIEEVEGGYEYTPNRRITQEKIYEEEVKDEIRKIKYATFTLTDKQKLEKIKTQLRLAEKTLVVTVPRSQGRRRVTIVRHVRDPNTSASMRIYYKDVCQYCGFDGNTKYGIGIAEVDHAIDEIANTQNNRPSNLVVLCPNCHFAKTKGILKFTDKEDHFVVKNAFTEEEKRIDKINLS